MTDAELEKAVADFVAAHWSADGERHGYSALVHSPDSGEAKAWFDALVERGWSVPSWPKAFGGPGWSRAEQVVFEQTLAMSGAPSPSNLGTQYVAPLLMEYCSGDQLSQMLDDIRLRRQQWCVGVVDLTPVTLTENRLNGVKAWVSSATDADQMLLTAQLNGQTVWCWIAMREPGVVIEPVPLMGGQNDVCRVEFAEASCPPDQQVHSVPQDWVPPLGAATWTRAARLMGGLARLEAFVERQDSDLAEDADLLRAKATLGVDLAALEGIEMRGAQIWAEAGDAQPLSQLATLKGVAVGQDLSTLVARSMGYYALPYPDELLLSNEGVIGDELALPAVKQMLFDRAWSMHTASGDGESVERVKNRIAVEVLGLPVDDDDGDHEQGD